MTATMISLALDDVFDSAVRAYGSSGVAGAPQIPELRHVSHGTQPAIVACDALVVHLSSLRTVEHGRCANSPLITLGIVVVRCWPTIDERGNYDETDAQTAALTLADDLATVWTQIDSDCRSDALLPSLPSVGCDDVTIGSGQPVGPSGAQAGFRLTLEIRVLP